MVRTAREMIQERGGIGREERAISQLTPLELQAYEKEQKKFGRQETKRLIFQKRYLKEYVKPSTTRIPREKSRTVGRAITGILGALVPEQAMVGAVSYAKKGKKGITFIEKRSQRLSTGGEIREIKLAKRKKMKGGRK